MANKFTFFIATCLGITLWSCQTEQIVTNEEIEQITISLNNVNKIDFTKSKNVLIDVRTPEEYKEGHIANAVNINVKDFDFSKKVSELDSTKNYYIYCRSGVRAKDAGLIMKKNNLKNVFIFKDGMLTYKGEVVE